ncbi:hypothetical protein M3Y97_00568400 [Aphelenchoides bicaudatus]|nr:hypothetical protein M3Y97_00568400 [Aphelenchoides bicaudatus]
MKYLVAAFVFGFVALTSAESSVHWQWRDLICKTTDGKGVDKISEKPAECRIALRENERDTNRRIASEEVNAGCFDEVVNGTTRSYCDLLCPNADTVYLIKRDPQVHRSCFVFYTHRLERRGNDWFLWRDKACRLSEITFTVRCEFLFGRSQFPNDNEVFSRLRTRS